MLFCHLVPPLSVCRFHLWGQNEFPPVQGSHFMWCSYHSFEDKSLEEDKQTPKSSCHTLDWTTKKNTLEDGSWVCIWRHGWSPGPSNWLYLCKVFFFFPDSFTSSQHFHPAVSSRIAKLLHMWVLHMDSLVFHKNDRHHASCWRLLVCTHIHSFLGLCILYPRALVWQVNCFSVSRWTDNLSPPVTSCKRLAPVKKLAPALGIQNSTENILSTSHLNTSLKEKNKTKHLNTSLETCESCLGYLDLLYETSMEFSSATKMLLNNKSQC